MTMTASQWAQQLLLGGLLGVLGQAIRVVVGLKKLNDRAQAAGTTFREAFSASTLVTSLLIGLVAGAVGVLSTQVNLEAVSRQDVLVLLGVGYAGADFIEGFVRKELPGGAGSGAPPARPADESAAGPDLQPPVG